ncbi:MAG: hypothetical protein E7535_11160 [Ruminococcaceae bacterium]|nr:hypothetical protein [Oscillospiraceae bacterium]
MKKSISIILAVLMLVSCIPMFASAADPVALTTANITEYPVANLINESGAFVGMTVGESVALSGGEVRYDSNGDGTLSDDEIVPGTFSIADPDTVPNISGDTNNRVSIKFTPDDEALFTGFESARDRNVQYYVQKTTPVFVDANDTIPVATEVEAGAYLADSILSGAAVTNPYNANEPKILTKTWTWDTSVNTPKKTVVNESGYYKARFLCPGYVTLTAWVLVRVKGDTSEVKIGTSIEELPTVNEVLKAGTHLSDVTLTGGKAVSMYGETISGTFSFENPFMLNQALTRSVNIVFTPDDNKYKPATSSIRITVEQGEYKFLDKDGKETVPVYTILYGTKIGDNNITIDTIIGQTGCYLNTTSKYSYDAPDGQNYIISDALYGTILPVGEHTFYVKVKPLGYTINETPPYEATTLAFIIKVEPVTMSVTNVSHSGFNNELTVTADKAGVSGTADIYIDGELIGDDISFADNSDKTKAIAKTEWAPEEKVNKEYTVKVVYNPIENDPVSMEDYEGTFRTNLPFTVYKDGFFTMYQGKNQVTGDSYSPAWEGITRIQCVVPYEQQSDFITWYITDEDGNELDIEIYGIEKTQGTGTQVGTLVETKVEAELTDTTIYFDMPNGNVRVSYKTQSMIDEEAKQEAIDNCNCLCHYTNPIAEFIWKIISFFMNLFGIDKPCYCGYPHIVK